MASVDWCKATIQKAGAMKKHNGKEERVSVNHSNEDIDKSKSELNVYIGADDYAPMLEKVKARIAEVDKEHPPKRNQGDRRITCIMLETPVPQAITEQGKAADFLRQAHKVIEDFFGAENVGGTCGHFDEQHTYTDKDGKERMSLVHGHTLCAAYAEWTDKKTGEFRQGINGKNCETKARLTALNKAMDEMCRREYGISYNTAETPERKSVERLKEETALRETADGLRKDIAELSEKKTECLDNFLNAIPPVKKEPYPEKPDIPSGYEWSKRPEVTSSGAIGKFQEHKQKEWDKQRETSIRKRDEKYEKACAEVDKRNEAAQQEWDSKYLTADNLRKAEQQIAPRMANVRNLEQQAKADRARAAAERERAEQERKLAEQERKKIAESVQNEAERLVREREDKLFTSDGKSRTQRLESFCEDVKFSDGESVLDKFEKAEDKLRKKFRGLTR